MADFRRSAAALLLAPALALMLTLTPTLTLATAHALPDPTRPDPASPPAATTTSSHATRWTLNAIVIGKTRRLASINGRMVAVDSHVDGARVIAISPDTVRLDTGGRPLTLHLYADDFKTVVH